MKQNFIFYLLVILNIGNIAFSMEDVPQVIKDIRTAYAEAQRLESSENEADKEAALVEYGKIADMVIPEPPPSTGWFPTFVNPYNPEIAMQKKAIEKIEDSVAWGTDQEKLAAYKKYAPKHFAQEIKNLETAITGKEADETSRAQEDVFNKANEAAGEGNYTRAKQIIQSFIDTNPSATLKAKAVTLLADIENQEAAPAKLLVTALQKLTNGLTQVKNKISKPA